ncbi:calcium/calmodulin-dependent protein kinase kinase 1-like [Paramacrobiotus metropolitanus]|uniref:calcium/calmodulin-dependent protein kinase kinase 1-like n=1 Tax=Paramacrobiotus metropolitanus TaxID=2943436 RepID=UPI002445821B|nr:calcium/calmodulin-dependent protein kinase kinase 1-like [Paramacrobiotus metropolitanus]
MPAVAARSRHPPPMNANAKIGPLRPPPPPPVSAAKTLICPFHARYKARHAATANGNSSANNTAVRPPFLRHMVKSFSIDQPDYELTANSPTQEHYRRQHIGFYQRQQLRQHEQRLRKNALLTSTAHPPPHAGHSSATAALSAAAVATAAAAVDDASSQQSHEAAADVAAISMPVSAAVDPDPALLALHSLTVHPDSAVLSAKVAALRRDASLGGGSPGMTTRHSLTTPLSLASNPRSFPYLPAAAADQRIPSPTSTVTAAHQYPTVSKMFAKGGPNAAVDSAAYEAVRISDVGDGYVYLNQYKLSNETLGHGTYSIVKLAYNTEDNTHYAMKILSKKKLMKKHRLTRKAGDPMQEAYREIAILKKLNHPNIIRLIEVLDDPHEDSLYMVFELLERGEVLVVPTEKPLTETVAWRYFRDLVLGVEYLHHNGILHRDLKPSNLLLDDNDHLKIADFGLSHMFEGSDALLSGTVGTPAFHAPEILSLQPSGSNHHPPSTSPSALFPNNKTEGRAAGAGVSGLAMDVWSMGITLYSLVFGDVPFRDESIVGLHHQIKSFPPVFPAHVVVSDALQDLVTRLLDKDPDRRLTIARMREHPWITRDGQEPLLPAPADNCQAPISVTEEDIQASVRSIPHLDTLILIKAMLKRGSFHHPFKGDLWDTRKGSLDSNLPPAAPT